MAKKGKEKAPAAPPPATSSSSKKSSKQTAPPPPREDDFIVFTNSNKEPKRKNQGNAAAGKSGGPEADASGPPKPTVKQIVGGASWTGKLPVNLLSEHCQRQKWDRPSYDNVSGDLDVVGRT
jgi:ATP-dependent RNA helicase DHX57